MTSWGIFFKYCHISMMICLGQKFPIITCFSSVCGLLLLLSLSLFISQNIVLWTLFSILCRNSTTPLFQSHADPTDPHHLWLCVILYSRCTPSAHICRTAGIQLQHLPAFSVKAASAKSMVPWWNVRHFPGSPSVRRPWPPSMRDSG